MVGPCHRSWVGRLTRCLSGCLHIFQLYILFSAERETFDGFGQWVSWITLHHPCAFSIMQRHLTPNVLHLIKLKFKNTIFVPRVSWTTRKARIVVPWRDGWMAFRDMEHNPSVMVECSFEKCRISIGTSDDNAVARGVRQIAVWERGRVIWLRAWCFTRNCLFFVHKHWFFFFEWARLFWGLKTGHPLEFGAHQNRVITVINLGHTKLTF